MARPETQKASGALRSGDHRPARTTVHSENGQCEMCGEQPDTHIDDLWLCSECAGLYEDDKYLRGMEEWE